MQTHQQQIEENTKVSCCFARGHLGCSDAAWEGLRHTITTQKYIYLFIHLFIYLFIYLHIYIFIDLQIYIYICVCDCIIMIQTHLANPRIRFLLGSCKHWLGSRLQSLGGITPVRELMGHRMLIHNMDVGQNGRPRGPQMLV